MTTKDITQMTAAELKAYRKELKAIEKKLIETEKAEKAEKRKEKKKLQAKNHIDSIAKKTKKIFELGFTKAQIESAFAKILTELN